MADMVNHPPHYKGNRLESIDVIEDFGLGFHLGNAIKYILRAGKKGNKLEDLGKAIWYLERECHNIAEEKIAGWTCNGVLTDEMRKLINEMGPGKIIQCCKEMEGVFGDGKETQ